MYQPGYVPDSPDDLVRWLRQEYPRIARALNADVRELKTSTTSIQNIAGDLWILANAYWDPIQQQFYRIDTSRASFGVQVQAQNYIPGEPALGYFVSGATIWVAQPESYTLIRGGGTTSGNLYGAVGGWELGFTLTQQRSLTVGGMGIEIDGSGTTPYGRAVHNTTGTNFSRKCTGIARNLYADFSSVDDNTKDSWFVGYTEQFDGSGNLVAGSPRMAMVRVPAGTTTWTELMSADASGNLRLNGQPIVPSNAPATSTSTGIQGQVAWDANYVYICTATNTWKRTALSSF